MRRTIRYHVLRAPALAMLALGLAGCMDYTFETTLEPDGSGVRVERMEVTRHDDLPLSEAEFRALTGATPDEGWGVTTRVDEDGDTTWVFERRREIDELAGWSDLSSRTLIVGTTPDQAAHRLGYVRLGDVAFRSSIQVGVARQSDGTSLVTYRERFLWDHVADAIVEFMLRDLEGALQTRYPDLTATDRGAIVGFARARLWIAGEEGLFFGENQDEAVTRAVERTTAHALKIVRVRDPGADGDELRALLTDLLAAQDEEAERLFAQTLPGLNLGFNTSVVFRLTLPGRITTTNTGRRDGNTLEWRFSPLDDITSPIEVFAEAVIPGSGR
jgi:hypothetical protein